MEYKTAEEIAHSLSFYVDTGARCFESCVTEEEAIKAMRQYAEQEVRKHLEIAADKAHIRYDSRRAIDPYHVHKDSITGIKIELT